MVVSSGREREPWARRSLGFEPPPDVHLARLVEVEEQLAPPLLLLVGTRSSRNSPLTPTPMIGYAFACLPPLLCFGLPLRYLLRNEWPRLRQMLFFPLAGQMRPGQNIQRARLLRRLNGVEVSLPTADGRVVHCVWAPGDAADRDGGPAVLLLHANAMVLDDMADWAAYYLNLGAGVLLLLNDEMVCTRSVIIHGLVVCTRVFL